ncbi:MAG: hypothetical protein L0H59_16430 [Tomitella sp.]|nr:hypothetical protein [Tomitella sp.]
MRRETKTMTATEFASTVQRCPALEDLAARAWAATDSSVWPPVNTHMANVWRHHAWVLTVDAETGAAANYAAITGGDWTRAPETVRTEWVDQQWRLREWVSDLPHWQTILTRH